MTRSRGRTPPAAGVDLRPSQDGLVPTVVQDARDGTVLILAYSSARSFEELLRTGELVLFSRSRKELWRKGATSGNTAEVVALAVDCDGDAILVKVVPAGPMCHTGERGCFGDVLPREERQISPVLLRLETTVEERSRRRSPGSYTRELLEDDARRLKKVGEEATELVVAAALGDRDQVVWEGADLLYHMTVLLAAAGLGWPDLMGELARRAGERKGPSLSPSRPRHASRAGTSRRR